MSSAPIELNDAEQIAAVTALRASFSGIHLTDDDYELLAGAIAAINRVRVGDPAGTIRRNPDGDIAVAVPYGRLTGWRVYRQHEAEKRDDNVSTEFVGPAGDCDWPVIFTPDGAA